ncbi:MAG: PH domain-containing protein [Pirellula sp.]|nr:PH domain-containing protein [Pirellula sp.]
MSEQSNERQGLHHFSLLFEVATRIRQNLIPAIFASFSVVSGGIIGLYIGASIFGIAIVFSVIRYFTFRYQVIGNEFHVQQGLVFRQQKAIPLDRIQNVDSVQNIFHRLLKVAEVRIETASGSEPEATMRVLGLSQLQQLRESLRKANLNATADSSFEDRFVEAGQAVQEPRTDQVVLEISPKQLIHLGLLSNRGQVLAGIVLGYLIQGPTSSFIPAWLNPFRSFENVDSMNRDSVRNAIRGVSSDAGGAIASLGGYYRQLGNVGLVLVGILCFFVLVGIFRLFSAVWHVLRFYGYRLTIQGDSLHVDCGLFTKISATIPRDRIQVISVNQTWLMKFFGFVSVQLETSGGSEASSDDATQTVGRKWFIPIMKATELTRVLATLNRELIWTPADYDWQSLSEKAFARTCRWPIFIGIIIVTIGIAMYAFLKNNAGLWVAIWGGIGAVVLTLVEWKQSKSRKYARVDRYFVYQTGVFRKITSICFLDRVQSIQLSQSPFDRRWGMATLHFDTAGSGGLDHELSVALLDEDFAHQELCAWTALDVDREQTPN